MFNKVLIVDDSEAVHQIYKVTLKRYGCEMITALKREEGLDKLAVHTGVDLILIDMNMSLSRISGIDFIKQVKEQAATADIPIITVTMRGKNYPKEVFELSDGNLAKPFTSNEIHRLIEKMFPQAVSA